jgi:hypothetical protein
VATGPITLRLATRADLPALTALIDFAITAHLAAALTPAQVAAPLVRMERAL